MTSPEDRELRERAESLAGHQRAGGSRTRGQHWNPSGLPVSPIFFTIYLSGLFGYVEDKVPGIKALSFADDVAWLVGDEHEGTLSARLEEAFKVAAEWADANAVTFDTDQIS